MLAMCARLARFVKVIRSPGKNAARSSPWRVSQISIFKDGKGTDMGHLHCWAVPNEVLANSSPPPLHLD